MEDNKKQSSTIAGVVFVGCMMIGLGLGLYFHKVAVGIILGIGVGFVSMGLVWALFMKK